MFKKTYVSVSLLVVLTGWLLVGAKPVFAHAQQMMGTSQLGGVEQLEDEMMGSERHARVEQLMNKMLDSGLTSEERQEMIKMMRDPQAGPAVMSMMMRSQTQPFSSSGMMSGNMGWGSGAYQFWYWIFVLVVIVWLVVGVLAAIWLWRQLTK